MDGDGLITGSGGWKVFLLKKLTQSLHLCESEAGITDVFMLTWVRGILGEFDERCCNCFVVMGC